MKEKDTKKILSAALEEIERLRRMLTKMEIENDELKKKLRGKP